MSASSRNDRVGSSSVIAARSSFSRSISRTVLGSTTTDTTGLRISIDSKTIGAAGSHSVSPVRAFLIPRAPTMSPARASSTGSFFPPCIRNRRATFSFSPVAALRSVAPSAAFPE